VIVLKYHVKSSDELVNKIREEKDKRWCDLCNLSERAYDNYLTKKDVIDLLYDLQEYFNSDFPYEKSNCDRNVVFAFDLICRAAISAIEREEFDAPYVTNNLIGALNYLKIKNHN